MDPATAVMASAGFGASLATLVALVIDISKTTRDLARKLRYAPKNVERLIYDFEIFSSLLKEIQTAVKEDGETNTPRRLRKLWAASAAQMQNDMEEFQSVVSRLSNLMHEKSSSSALMRLRIRHLSSEAIVTRYQQRMSVHLRTMTMVQTIINK